MWVLGRLLLSELNNQANRSGMDYSALHINFVRHFLIVFRKFERVMILFHVERKG